MPRLGLKALIGLAAIGLGATPASASYFYFVGYVNSTTSSILRYDSSSPSAGATTVGTLSGTPQSIGVDASGNIYADIFGTIDKMTPSGVVSQIASSPYFGNSLAVDASGNVYVGTGVPSPFAFDGVIDRITPGGSVSQFTYRGNLTSIVALGSDSAGNIYDAEHFGGNVYVPSIARTNPAGVQTGNIYLPYDFYFVCMAGNASGNYYVAGDNVDSNSPFSIYKYSKNGMSVFAVTSVQNLLTDSAGNLYTLGSTSNGFEIDQFTPSGSLSVFAQGNSPRLASLSAFAIQPAAEAVPEPTSIVLCGIAGTIGIGYRVGRNLKTGRPA